MTGRWSELAKRAEAAGGKLTETQSGLFRLFDKDGAFVGTMTPADEDREFQMYENLVQLLERGEGLGR